jgi:hypothetical protein
VIDAPAFAFDGAMDLDGFPDVVLLAISADGSDFSGIGHCQPPLIRRSISLPSSVRAHDQSGDGFGFNQIVVIRKRAAAAQPLGLNPGQQADHLITGSDQLDYDSCAAVAETRHQRR